MRAAPPDPARLLELTLALCRIRSVSGRAGEENACADYIAATLKAVSASHGNVLEVATFDCENDSLGRKAVFALLTPPAAAPRTVLLTGHFDVVDAAVCGELEALAFDPQAYTRALGGKDIDEDARRDLEDGGWLFGRGTMDMKAGIALQIAAIETLAACPDLKLNVAFLAVPDEEADSAGMRGSLAGLVAKLQAKGLKLNAALTGEPCFWTRETEGRPAARPYYTGTTGKIMPLFYVLGREAHVGCYFEGMNAALVASRIVEIVEADPEAIDTEGSDTLPPAACLKLETRTGAYSVTLPDRAAAYFNMLHVRSTPGDVLAYCLRAARRAADDALRQIRTGAAAVTDRGGLAPFAEEIAVTTVSQVRDAARAAFANRESFEEAFGDWYAKACAKADAREAAVRSLEWMIEKAGLTGPAVIVGFVPPYYPPRLNRGETEDERRLALAVRSACEKGGALAGDDRTVMTEVFAGITDLSFLGFEAGREALEALSANLPAWGRAYDLPVEALLKLDVPVANMGPAGKDAHKATERLELGYSFKVAPALLLETLENLA